MPISRRLRFEVLRRDGYTCRYCGARAPDVTLTVDHVVPTTLGGDDDPRNLVTACQPCNAGKSSIQPDAPLVADVDASALLFAKAIERVHADRRSPNSSSSTSCSPHSTTPGGGRQPSARASTWRIAHSIGPDPSSSSSRTASHLRN